MANEIYANGLNADGTYLATGLTATQIADVARGHRLSVEEKSDLERRNATEKGRTRVMGVPDGIDSGNLAQTGWGVIFPASLPQKSVDAIKDALKPLLDHRRAQAAVKRDTYYKEFTGELGVLTGQSKNDWLKARGRTPGAADPDLGVPYYLLIVGSPETISFPFQYQLDVQYAVGRVYFEKLADYYQYAMSVVAAETKGLRRAAKAAFFGVSNPDDRATALSAEYLIKPLADGTAARYRLKGWDVESVPAERCTKADLSEYLGGNKTPAVLFTASHGINFHMDDPRQLHHQGALVMQDWPGPSVPGPVTDDMYFSTDDIASDADVFGTLAFFFACYGGGTPRDDNFWQQAFNQPKQIAPCSFMAPLPMRMLSHPRGGALGVFAHVERAWGSSIVWDEISDDAATFKNTVNALLEGEPAGAATEYLNARYAEISTELTTELQTSTREIQNEVKIAGLWTANNDARNYTFIGDPAVRLVVTGAETPAGERQKLSQLIIQHPAEVTSAAPVFQPDVEVRAPALLITGAESQVNYGYINLAGRPKTKSLGGEPATGSAVGESIKNLFNKLSDYLSVAVQDATSLNVYTYVAEDMDKVAYNQKTREFDGARKRAITRISIDGDTLVVVPETDGEIDTAVWGIHLEMVRQAQANRAELMKAIVSAASNLANILPK